MSLFNEYVRLISSFVFLVAETTTKPAVPVHQLTLPPSSAPRTQQVPVPTTQGHQNTIAHEGPSPVVNTPQTPLTMENRPIPNTQASPPHLAQAPTGSIQPQDMPRHPPVNLSCYPLTYLYGIFLCVVILTGFSFLFRAMASFSSRSFK